MGKRNSRVSLLELEGSNSKAMMLQLGALVDMKPMRGIQITMLNTVQIMAGILVPIQIMWLEHSMPHTEESKLVGMFIHLEGSMAVDMFIHMEGSMAVDMSMLRQRHTELIILEGMDMRWQHQCKNRYCHRRWVELAGREAGMICQRRF